MQLFHISEGPDIVTFVPRPSPSYYAALTTDVVFAVSGEMLHNYLLPRYCPRISYYVGPNTTIEDAATFHKHTDARFVLAIESGWLERIMNTTLYCYEFPIDSFILLDQGAGYYVSTQSVAPSSVREITNPLPELMKRNVEVRFCPTLWKLADSIQQTSLQFSMIRMRHATPRQND